MNRKFKEIMKHYVIQISLRQGNLAICLRKSDFFCSGSTDSKRRVTTASHVMLIVTWSFEMDESWLRYRISLIFCCAGGKESTARCRVLWTRSAMSAWRPPEACPWAGYTQRYSDVQTVHWKSLKQYAYADLASAWAMTRRRSRKYPRNVDAATRCSSVCPHTWPGLYCNPQFANVFVSSAFYVGNATSSFLFPSSFQMLLILFALNNIINMMFSHW